MWENSIPSSAGLICIRDQSLYLHMCNHEAVQGYWRNSKGQSWLRDWTCFFWMSMIFCKCWHEYIIPYDRWDLVKYRGIPYDRWDLVKYRGKVLLPPRIGHNVRIKSKSFDNSAQAYNFTVVWSWPITCVNSHWYIMGCPTLKFGLKSCRLDNKP